MRGILLKVTRAGREVASGIQDDDASLLHPT